MRNQREAGIIKKPPFSPKESVVRVLREVVSAEHEGNFVDRWGQADAINALTSLAAHYPSRSGARVRIRSMGKATASDYRAVVGDLERLEDGELYFAPPTQEAIQYIQFRRENVLAAELSNPDWYLGRGRIYRRIVAASMGTGLVVSEVAAAHSSFGSAEAGATFGLVLGVGIVNVLRQRTPTPLDAANDRIDKERELIQLRRSREDRES